MEKNIDPIHVGTPTLLTERICPVCKGNYRPKRKWQRYCHPKCRWIDWDRLHPRMNPPRLG